MKKIVIVFILFVVSCAAKISDNGSLSRADEEFKISGKGLLSRTDIISEVKNSQENFEKCYMGSQHLDPAIEAQLKMYFEIEENGKVENAKVESSKYYTGKRELARLYLEKCLIKNINTLSFPPPKGAGVIKVTYPFKFTRDGR